VVDETPSGKTRPDSLTSMAKILEGYVSKSEHAELLDAYNALTETHAKLTKQFEGVDVKDVKKLMARAQEFEGVDLKKLKDRNQELEGKVRTRSYQDAYKGLVDELGINPEFTDEVYELSKITVDADEPDLKAMKSLLTDFLELKPKFKAPAKTEEQAPDLTPTKKTLKSEGESSRGDQLRGTKFRFKGSDLSDPLWMQQHGADYAEAVATNNAVKVDG
jgi:hypothetical protein